MSFLQGQRLVVDTLDRSPHAWIKCSLREGLPTPFLLWCIQQMIYYTIVIHSKVTDIVFTIGNLVACRKSSTSWTASSSSTWDPENSNNKGRDCGWKKFSEKELSSLVHVVNKFESGWRDRATSECSVLCPKQRIRSWMEAKDGRTCQNRFDKLVPKQRPNWFYRGSSFSSSSLCESKKL